MKKLKNVKVFVLQEQVFVVIKVQLYVVQNSIVPYTLKMVFNYMNLKKNWMRRMLREKRLKKRQGNVL